MSARRFRDHGTFESGKTFDDWRKCGLCVREADGRGSALGMSKLFSMPDERLRKVLVKGDLIINEANANSEWAR